MKVVVGVFALLYLQASASFVDKLRGAVSNVEHGVGKLVTNVVTNVQDTIHCTLSAVEKVLILNGLLDKTAVQNYRCRNLVKHKPPPYDIAERSQKSLESIDTFKNRNHPTHQFSTKRISPEIENSIANTNKTINDFLSRSSINKELKFESELLEKETHRLTEVSNTLKKELEKLSNNVKNKIRNLQHDLRDSVESIWSQVKALHELQQSGKDESEINEIRNVLNTVVDKLEIPAKTHKNAGIYNMEDIRKQLFSYSPRHVISRKNNETTTPYLKLNQLETTTKKSEDDDVSQMFKRDRKSSKGSSNVVKSVFDLNVDSSNYLTPFLNVRSNPKETIDNARKLIQDSKHTDKILNNLFQNKRSGEDVFSNSNKFSFGKK